ncbi:hypothetical protein ACFWP7_04785 [Streptomyces sp. NPDC058470]|uniref:hypothetical protein n=1 Tax=Streptomyces sp. NPDC058470 TaxID=3346515 RepID=UPI003652DF55
MLKKILDGATDSLKRPLEPLPAPGRSSRPSGNWQTLSGAWVTLRGRPPSRWPRPSHGSSSISTEDQWSSYLRMAQVDGIFATSETGTDLKVTASNASNASTVSVAAGEAWIQGTYYANSAALNVSVPTNSGGGSARNDLIVLRRDPSADATTVQYRTGGTSFPTLTQTLNGTWEIPLAWATVAAGASVVPPSGLQARVSELAPEVPCCSEPPAAEPAGS